MKLGFIAPPVSGHMNPMIALGRRLQARGHEVIFFNILDMESRVRDAGLGFVSFGEDTHPLNSSEREWAQLASLHGLDVMRRGIKKLAVPLLSAAYAEVPALMRRECIDAAVCDTALTFAELIPMSINMPFIQIWNALHWHPTGLMPNPFVPGVFEASPEARAKNLADMQLVGETLAPLIPIASGFAESSGLAIDWSIPNATTSKLAVISQTPRAFDFPVDDWPPTFHRTAPFLDEDGRASVAFPWERLTGEPLIYGSLGTMLNGHPGHYAAIVTGAAHMPGTQLVLSVGPNVNLEIFGTVPNNAILVRFAPQTALLRKASLCVTHAGLNTVLESLMSGVPLVALPIGFEQSGVAARIAYHGVGESVAFEDVNPERVAETMRKVLTQSNYRERAKQLGVEIALLDGPDMAADIIERVLESERL
jgi:MGT family glycosyltransferase